MYAWPVCGDRGNKTKPDTQGCGQNQALDCRATGNFHDFLSSKRGFLRFGASLICEKRADSAVPCVQDNCPATISHNLA